MANRVVQGNEGRLGPRHSDWSLDHGDEQGQLPYLWLGFQAYHDMANVHCETRIRQQMCDRVKQACSWREAAANSLRTQWPG